MKTLMEELSAVRKSLIDKDAELSQLRLQFHDATSKIIVVKVETQQIRFRTIKKLHSSYKTNTHTITKINVSTHSSMSIDDLQESAEYMSLVNQLELKVQELEAARREIERLNKNIQSVHTEFISVRKQSDVVSIFELLYLNIYNRITSNWGLVKSVFDWSSILIPRIFGVQGYELRVNQLNDEIATLRKTLNEREDQISNLRIEMHKSTTRVIDYKARRRRIQWFFWK